MPRRRRARFDYGYGGFAPYVPVAQRRAEAARHAKALTKKGQTLRPVVIEGRTIARTFWGRAFCAHLDHFAKLSNRLARGRSYVRNGSVVHLAIERCAIRALVSGSRVYEVNIAMKPAPPARWKALTAACTGHIGSLVELLGGRFDDATMQKLIAPDAGLLPREGELSYSCSCPDGAGGGWVCKHVAAAMFGAGARLDDAPELLFQLRDVDPGDLLAAVATGDVTRSKKRPRAALAEADLEDVFGIEIAPPSTRAAPRARPKAAKPKPKKPSPTRTRGKG